MMVVSGTGSTRGREDGSCLEDVGVLVEGDEQVHRPFGRLGVAEEQVAAGPQAVVERLHHARLRLTVQSR